MKVKVKLMNSRAKMPVKASKDAAGWDVYAIDEHIIPGDAPTPMRGVDEEIRNGF